MISVRPAKAFGFGGPVVKLNDAPTIRKYANIAMRSSEEVGPRYSSRSSLICSPSTIRRLRDIPLSIE